MAAFIRLQQLSNVYSRPSCFMQDEPLESAVEQFLMMEPVQPIRIGVTGLSHEDEGFLQRAA